MNSDNKIDLANLHMLEDYLRDLLFDNFLGIEIDEKFICKIKDFPNTKVIITKL